MPKPPNILFLMSDEHRADVSGFGGNSVVRTPALDELARTGTVFQNAYTPAPICVPARQCIAAGQLPRTCNCFQFGQDLEPFSMTFPKRFSQYGYQTVCAGKLHHMGADQMQGWRQRIGSSTFVDTKYIEGYQENASQVSPIKFKWSDAKEIQRAGIGRGSSTQDEDEHALDGTLKFIDRYFADSYYDRAIGNDVPLLLKVSFNRPHYPYFTTEEKFQYYLNRVPLYLEKETFDHPFLSQHRVEPGKDVNEREIRRATAAYYGMIEEIDEDYGKILDRLRHVGQDPDDWIIIYTSDHGEMLGEHGIWEKQKFFEGSVRVPLIIRWPKRFKESSVVKENVNLCDLFATLCDLAEIPIPEGLDSRSLTNLLEGKSEGWSDESISHFQSYQSETNLMIKQGALKYQYYGEESPEVLFDLEEDASERRNLIGESKYKEDLKHFRQRRDELGYGPNGDKNYKNAGYA